MGDIQCTSMRHKMLLFMKILRQVKKRGCIRMMMRSRMSMAWKPKTNRLFHEDGKKHGAKVMEPCTISTNMTRGNQCGSDLLCLLLLWGGRYKHMQSTGTTLKILRMEPHNGSIHSMVIRNMSDLI